MRGQQLPCHSTRLTTRVHPPPKPGEVQSSHSFTLGESSPYQSSRLKSFKSAQTLPILCHYVYAPANWSLCPNLVHCFPAHSHSLVNPTTAGCPRFQALLPVHMHCATLPTCDSLQLIRAPPAQVSVGVEGVLLLLRLGLLQEGAPRGKSSLYLLLRDAMVCKQPSKGHS